MSSESPHTLIVDRIEPSRALSAISLGNPQDMNGGQFLAMDAVVGRVRILPLFLGRTEIAEFQLVHPRLALRIDVAGRSNWKVKSDGPSPPDRADRKAGNITAKAPPDPSRDLICVGQVS